MMLTWPAQSSQLPLLLFPTFATQTHRISHLSLSLHMFVILKPSHCAPSVRHSISMAYIETSCLHSQLIKYTKFLTSTSNSTIMFPWKFVTNNLEANIITFNIKPISPAFMCEYECTIRIILKMSSLTVDSKVS